RIRFWFFDGGFMGNPPSEYQNPLHMKCPYCGHEEDRVLDSRPLEGASIIRRRRECQLCHKRFTTYERLESVPLMVIKSDDRREPFNREKLREGILRACEKRPI